MKLAIGTVQFGLDYGVANGSGRVPLPEVEKILQIGEAAGIHTLDTAIAYGISEQILGSIGVQGWEVITKLPPLPQGYENARSWVRTQVEQSLERLGVGELSGLLLHKASDLLGKHGKEIASGLQEMKECGLVKKTGYSIYSPDILPSLFPIHLPDLVQAPLNVIDRRLIESSALQRLVDQGVEVHARSIFLQGLLLMKPEKRPKYFDKWSDLWKLWDACVEANEGDTLSSCLSFVKQESRISKMVVGVDNSVHLQQLIDKYQLASGEAPISLSCSDTLLVDPSNWRIQ